MPVIENDPWRLQYFADLPCPDDVIIPTDDGVAYVLYPSHRWIFNKLTVADSQGLECAPHGVDPTHYPVFSKPIMNLRGMGTGSRPLTSQSDYLRHVQPGHMWMTLLEGEHVSSDFAVVDGETAWCRHTVGLTKPGGIFDYWIVEEGRRPELERYCTQWIRARLAGYTGMVNLETIGGRIIDAHLRFADQWPDLYGNGWLDAMVNLYVNRVWTHLNSDRKPGYSVVLFGPPSSSYAYPPEDTTAAIFGMGGISSLQYTFHENMAASAHAMPPGGFRLAIINCWRLDAGFRARSVLAAQFGVSP